MFAGADGLPAWFEFPVDKCPERSPAFLNVTGSPRFFLSAMRLHIGQAQPSLCWPGARFGVSLAAGVALAAAGAVEGGVCACEASEGESMRNSMGLARAL